MAWLQKIMTWVAIVLDALQTVLNDLNPTAPTTNANAHLKLVQASFPKK